LNLATIKKKDKLLIKRKLFLIQQADIFDNFSTKNGWNKKSARKILKNQKKCWL